MTLIHDYAETERLFNDIFNREIDLFPVQIQRPADDTPEELLMRAVLDDGLSCVQRHMLGPQSARSERLLEEDVNWFASHEADYLYSFENICDELNLSPDYIRQGVFDLLAKRVQETAPKLYRRRATTQHRKHRQMNEHRQRHAA